MCGGGGFAKVAPQISIISGRQIHIEILDRNNLIDVVSLSQIGDWSVFVILL